VASFPRHGGRERRLNPVGSIQKKQTRDLFPNFPGTKNSNQQALNSFPIIWRFLDRDAFDQGLLLDFDRRTSDQNIRCLMPRKLKTNLRRFLPGHKIRNEYLGKYGSGCWEPEGSRRRSAINLNTIRKRPFGQRPNIFPI